MKEGDDSEGVPVTSSDLEKAKAELNKYLSKEVEVVASDVEVCSELVLLATEALTRARKSSEEKERKTTERVEDMKAGERAESKDIATSDTTISSDGAVGVTGESK